MKSDQIHARLLATENINLQYVPGLATAYFDVKRRTLALPVYENVSDTIKQMLIVHEVGHALDTDPKMWNDTIEALGKDFDISQEIAHSYLNICEDVRIEKRQKRRYPGSRKNFITGWKELWDRGFFGKDMTVADFQKLNFPDRINIQAKLGTQVNIQFSPEETEIWNIINAAETMEETVAATVLLTKYMKSKEKKKRPRKKAVPLWSSLLSADDIENMFEPDELIDIDLTDLNDDFLDTDGDMNALQDAMSGSGKSAENDDEEEVGDADEAADLPKTGKAAPIISQYDSENDADVPVHDEEIPEELTYGDDFTEDYVAPSLESETVKASNEFLNGILAEAKTEYVYTKLPKVDLKTAIVDYKQVLAEIALKDFKGNKSAEVATQKFADFRKGENETVSFMVKEFEMRKAAAEYQRTYIARSGQLNVNKLHSYKFTEDLFKKNTLVHAGKNHGFILLVDWSVSMSSILDKTIDQVLSFAFFCKRIGVPFEVFTFGFRSQQNKETFVPSFINEPDAAVIKFQPNVQLRNVLSSRMTLMEFNKATLNLSMCKWDRFKNDDEYLVYSTPLLESFMILNEYMEVFKKRNNVQVMNLVALTDGAGANVEIKDNRTEYNTVAVRKEYFITDEKTKKTYAKKVSYPYKESYLEMQDIMLTSIRDRYNCNIIGYLLQSLDSSKAKNVAYNMENVSNVGYEASRLKVKEMRVNGYTSLPVPGYDQFFVTDVPSLRTGDAMTGKKATKAQLLKDFVRVQKKKKRNRIVLREFVDKIAA